MHEFSPFIPYLAAGSRAGHPRRGLRRSRQLGDAVELHPLDVAQVHRLALALRQRLRQTPYYVGHIVAIDAVGLAFPVGVFESRHQTVALAAAKTVEADVAHAHHRQRRESVAPDQQAAAPQLFVEILRGILGGMAVAEQTQGVTERRVLDLQKLRVELFTLHFAALLRRVRDAIRK